MNLLALLLWPFTLLYGLITQFRNFLYDKKLIRSFRFEVFTISVGNLAVGGTGKTPHVEYLIRLLKPAYTLSTLSRGYGRKTSGFILADEQASATSIGDEPMQFFHKYGQEISVAVGEDRALAIPAILYEKPATQLILLDDAFQHRSVRPHINILLSDYNRLFYQDFTFPLGLLREKRSGAKRADIVIISKCPSSISEKERKDITTHVRRYAREGAIVLFTAIRYAQPVPFLPNQKEPLAENVLLVSGIANPAPFIGYVADHYHIEEQCTFNDHHAYTTRDMEKIKATFLATGEDPTRKSILTTEKDYTKLSAPAFRSFTEALPFYYLPIEIYFLENEGKEFDSLVLNSVKDFLSARMEEEHLP